MRPAAVHTESTPIRKISARSPVVQAMVGTRPLGPFSDVSGYCNGSDSDMLRLLAMSTPAQRSLHPLSTPKPARTLTFAGSAGCAILLPLAGGAAYSRIQSYSALHQHETRLTANGSRSVVSRPQAAAGRAQIRQSHRGARTSGP